MSSPSIHICKDYLSMSAQAGPKIIELLASYDRPLICPAAGNSPAGLYQFLYGQRQEKTLKPQRWNFIGLDEWVGMNGADAGSCRYFLNHSLFGPLGIHSEAISFFDGRSPDLDGECRKAEAFIRDRGVIDVMVLGLGLNGHIGFNEPGTAADERSHVVDLSPSSVAAGKKYFDNRDAPPRGISLGLANIMESRHVILVVNGSAKAAIVKKMLEEDISPQVPASLLRQHPHCDIFLDQDAAASLK